MNEPSQTNEVNKTTRQAQVVKIEKVEINTKVSRRNDLFMIIPN